MAILSSSITHEIRNYLAAININIHANLSEDELRKIKEKISAADYVIGNLQQQIRGVVATNKIDTKDFKRCSIIKNIEETLEQYPFKTEERLLVTVEAIKDFEHMGDPILTKHILFNLIKNALRAISNADKGKIIIKLESGVKFNKLLFIDTATGVKKEFLSKMFDLFESQSTTQGGTGVGLSFCKLIMESYDGDIVCDSAKGEYTEFKLSFPCIIE
jgi:signal transduction histidine kinase